MSKLNYQIKQNDTFSRLKRSKLRFHSATFRVLFIRSTGSATDAECADNKKSYVTKKWFAPCLCGLSACSLRRKKAQRCLICNLHVNSRTRSRWQFKSWLVMQWKVVISVTGFWFQMVPFLLPYQTHIKGYFDINRPPQSYNLIFFFFLERFELYRKMVYDWTVLFLCCAYLASKDFFLYSRKICINVDRLTQSIVWLKQYLYQLTISFIMTINTNTT